MKFKAVPRHPIHTLAPPRSTLESLCSPETIPNPIKSITPKPPGTQSNARKAGGLPWRAREGGAAHPPALASSAVTAPVPEVRREASGVKGLERRRVGCRRTARAP